MAEQKVLQPVDLVGIGNLLAHLVAKDVISCEERDRIIQRIAQKNGLTDPALAFLAGFGQSKDDALAKTAHEKQLEALPRKDGGEYVSLILVFGCIQQAIDVIVSCVEYGCIPYIRYPVSLHYVSLLSESMLDIEHIIILRYKMSVSFAVHRLCDKEKLAKVPLDEFLRKNENIILIKSCSVHWSNIESMKRIFLSIRFLN